MINQENFNNLNNIKNQDEEYISGNDYREQLQALSPQAQISTKLGWQQKAGVVFLIIFGVSAMILWAVQFKSGLQVTEPLTAGQLAKLQADRSGDTTDTAADLRAKDTDKDGLSDYDELYVYSTSPYLEDSDSDNILDKKEIEQGTDPNCPNGQDCSNQTVSNATDATGDIATTSAQNSAIPSLSNSTNTATAGADSSLMQSILSGATDAKSLRAMLLQVGMSEDTLNKISDEQLISVYKQTLDSSNK
ncbi:MAG: hypothetical protein WCV41_00340 [Patescibacteria group bacterium]